MKFGIFCLCYCVVLQYTCVCLEPVCHYSFDFYNNGTKVDCSDKHLSNIPDNLPVNTTYLDLSFNNLVVIPNSSFCYLKQLKILDLSFNKVHVIKERAFSGLEHLIQLDINGHELNYNNNNSFPENVFMPLKSLQFLSLRSFTRYERPLILPDRAFENLLNLVELSVDTGSEVEFREGFSKLQSLQLIDLGDRFSHGTRFRCQLKKITNNTFFMFRNLPIKTFKIVGCQFDYLGNMYLNSFPVVENLYLQGIQSPGKTLLVTIQAMSIYQNKSLNHVDLSNILPSIFELEFQVFLNLSILSNICITYLDLSGNDIVSIDLDKLFDVYPLPPLSKCLTVVLMSHNRLRGKINAGFVFLGLPLLTKLKKVDVSLQRNSHVVEPRLIFSDNAPLPLPVFLPPNLEYVDAAALGYSASMMGVHFFNGDRMRYLNVSFLGMHTFSGQIAGLDDLKILDLSGNDCSEMIINFFDTLRNLTFLGLKNVQFQTAYILKNSKRLLSPLTQLKKLDMSNNGLHVLPFDLFSDLANLEEINLGGNRLVSIPDLSMLSAVKLINLAFNSFVILDVKYRTMFDSMGPNVSICLSGNLLSCACSSSDFLFWLNETKVNLDGRNYSCIDEDGHVTSIQEVFYNFDFYHRKCSSALWLNVSTAGLLLLLVFVLAAFLVAKNTMKLKLVLLRMIGQYVYPEKRRDFVYDLNVLYSNQDYRFACIDLFNKIERQYGLKLNLSDRDYMPGDEIMISICESIQTSWKIILTEEFLKWELSFFILCNCLSSIKLTTPNRLILIIDSDVNIPTNIEFLLESVSQENIIQIDIKQEQTDQFWKHLYDMIID